jgi:hypothetical protein
MVATVCHVTSGLGLRKYQAAWFMFHRVYQYLQICFPVNPLCLEKRWTLLISWEFPSDKATCRFIYCVFKSSSIFSVFSYHKENWNCQHTHSFTSVVQSEPWELNSRWLGCALFQKLFCANPIVSSFLLHFTDLFSNFGSSSIAKPLFITAILVEEIFVYLYCCQKLMSPSICVRARWSCSLLDWSVLPSVFMANKLSYAATVATRT